MLIATSLPRTLVEGGLTSVQLWNGELTTGQKLRLGISYVTLYGFYGNLFDLSTVNTAWPIVCANLFYSETVTGDGIVGEPIWQFGLSISGTKEYKPSQEYFNTPGFYRLLLTNNSRNSSAYSGFTGGVEIL
jgi:hypothetical protein